MSNKIMYTILYIIMGAIYCLIEMIFRGHTHWTMFLLGGLCGVLIGLLNEKKFTWDTSIITMVIYAEMIVLPLEFITGVILHKILKIHPPIWDYSDLPFNLWGQSSLLFAIMFIPIIILAILVDDYIRFILFNGKKPKYKII